MKTLKDVYIKVNKSNQEELQEILQYPLAIDVVIVFEFDNKDSWYISDDTYCEKVSLSQLKRLIETIPTREEITRLKRQISAYKTNYDKVVKHSLSKEVVIDNIQKENEYIHCILEELREKHQIVCNSYKDALKLNEEITTEKYYFRQQYKMAQKEIERLKNKKWYQIWK